MKQNYFLLIFFGCVFSASSQILNYGVIDYNIKTNTLPQNVEMSINDVVANKSINAAASHLNFDGTDDHIVLTNFAIPTSFTFEAIVKTNVTNNTGWLISWLSGNDFSTKKQIGVHNGRVLYRDYGSNLFFSTYGNINISDDVWHHIAVVKTNDATNNVLLYVDGVLDIIGTTEVDNTIYENVIIGADLYIPFVPPVSFNQETTELATTQINNYQPLSLYQGDLDEVRVWNRSLSLAEIQNNQNCELATPISQTGLVAYYQFNQGNDSEINTAVSTLTDSSVNGYDGTLTNFTLNGSLSNWIAGSSIVTGNSCTPFLSSPSFISSYQLKIYPNPIKNEVTIRFNALTNPQLEIIDLNGRVLLKQSLNIENNTLNLASLPSGIYLFKINSKEGLSISKLIKN